MVETNFDAVKHFISFNVTQLLEIVSMSVLIKLYGDNQGKKYRGRLIEKVIQAFPKKLMLFQPNYHVLEIVVSKDSTLEKNIDTLVDKRAYINKAAGYISEEIIRFFQ